MPHELHPLVRYFVQEVGAQCEQIQYGHDLIDRELRSLPEVNWLAFKFAVQGFLVAAGNVSKMLWPSEKRRTRTFFPDRGSELRRTLDVPDMSPLRPRTFRNHFEHFDERLEEWYGKDTRRVFVDWNIMYKGAIAGIAPETFLRNFDNVAGSITFQGDEYPLTPIAEAAQVIGARAAEVESFR